MRLLLFLPLLAWAQPRGSKLGDPFRLWAQPSSPVQGPPTPRRPGPRTPIPTRTAPRPYVPKPRPPLRPRFTLSSHSWPGPSRGAPNSGIPSVSGHSPPAPSRDRPPPAAPAPAPPSPPAPPHDPTSPSPGPRSDPGSLYPPTPGLDPAAGLQTRGSLPSLGTALQPRPGTANPPPPRPPHPHPHPHRPTTLRPQAQAPAQTQVHSILPLLAWTQPRGSKLGDPFRLWAQPSSPVQGPPTPRRPGPRTPIPTRTAPRPYVPKPRPPLRPRPQPQRWERPRAVERIPTRDPGPTIATLPLAQWNRKNRLVRREKSLRSVPLLGAKITVGAKDPTVQHLAWYGAVEAAKTSLGVYHLIPVKVVKASREGHLGYLWELDLIMGESSCKKYEFDFYDFGRIRSCGLARDTRYSRCELRVWQRGWIEEPELREIFALRGCRAATEEEAL